MPFRGSLGQHLQKDRACRYIEKRLGPEAQPRPADALEGLSPALLSLVFLETVLCFNT